MLRLLPLLACAACADPDPVPLDPGPAVERVVATLDEAARLDRDHRDAEAVLAWQRALGTFEEGVEPWLRANFSPAEVARLEHGFALVRSEVDLPDGRPGARVEALTRALRACQPESSVEKPAPGS